jgi:phosphoribosylanthranilate isomerase
MQPFQRTRIKVCCISSVAEAALAIRYGASAIGLVSAMPSGPGVIPEDRIAEIARRIPPGVATFLLTSKQNVDEIVVQQRRCLVNTLQLVDKLPGDAYRSLHAQLPGISLVQVVHIMGPASVHEALQAARHADALLLDSGNPTASVKELGGTGRVHDWTISRMIVDQSPVPVYLAGGLRAENVGSAIKEVHPFGADVCSGVRTDGALDEQLLADFMKAVREADTVSSADEAARNAL